MAAVVALVALVALVAPGGGSGVTSAAPAGTALERDGRVGNSLEFSGISSGIPLEFLLWNSTPQ